MMTLANVVNDRLGHRSVRELALRVDLPCDHVVAAGVDDQFQQQPRSKLTQLHGWIGLDVAVEQVAHVCLVRRDVELLVDLLVQLVAEYWCSRGTFLWPPSKSTP
jgi:hypothetical protein